MAFALLTHASGSGIVTATTTAISTLGADLIVLALSGNPGTGTPTDSKMNSWSGGGSYISDFSSAVQIWYCAAPVTDGSHTFTNPDAQSSITVAALSGSNAAPFDSATGTNALAVPNANCPSITPAQNNSLIVAIGGTGWTNTTTVDSGFTVTDFVDLGSVFSIVMAYLIQGSAAAVAPTFSPSSFDGFGQSAVAIAVFKPAVAAAGKTFFLIPN
jgi:hypothetical protein